MRYERLNKLLPNYWRTINPTLFILKNLGISPQELLARKWIYFQLRRQKKIPWELLEQIEVEIFRSSLPENNNNGITDSEILFLRDNLFTTIILRKEIESLEELTEKASREYFWKLVNEDWTQFFPQWKNERKKLREKEILLSQKEKRLEEIWKKIVPQEKIALVELAQWREVRSHESEIRLIEFDIREEIIGKYEEVRTRAETETWWLKGFLTQSKERVVKLERELVNQKEVVKQLNNSQAELQKLYEKCCRDKNHWINLSQANLDKHLAEKREWSAEISQLNQQIMVRQGTIARLEKTITNLQSKNRIEAKETGTLTNKNQIGSHIMFLLMGIAIGLALFNLGRVILITKRKETKKKCGKN